MRSSNSIFDKDVTFPHGGKIYTIEKKVPDLGNYNSLTPSQYETYLITTEDEEYILKMIQTQPNQPRFSYDSEDEQQIDKEYQVLQKISKHPHTLKCIGKVNIVDKFQNIHTSLILKKLSCNSLERYFETTVPKLNLQALVNLSNSLIDAFFAFENENILFNDELTLSYFGVDEEGNIVITNGFSFCTILEQEISEEEKQTYIYKKNCAQIKSIVFSILTANKELSKKYSTTYNLQSSVDKIIQLNKSLQSMFQTFPKFESIFKDNNLISLKNLLDHLNKFGGLTPLQKQMNRQDSMMKSQSKMERLQKMPSQIFKVTINSEMSEQATPEDKAAIYDISTITEDDEREQNEDSQSFQIIDMKNLNQGNYSVNTNQPVARQLVMEEEQEETEYNIENTKNILGTPQKQKVVGFVEIEMQAQSKGIVHSQKPLNNNYVPPQEVSQVSEFSQNIFQNNSQQQARSSIQSQASNQSESFRKKADKLKEEEIEEISQQIKHKQKEKGDFQRRKKQLQQAKEIEEQMRKQQIVKQLTDIENQYRSKNSDTPMNPNNEDKESARGKSDSLSDKLLISKFESNSLISDANVVKILIGLLLVFIVGGIIFGAVFNFGVSDNKNDETIVCLDQNCEYCARYSDECTTCKSDYYYDSYSLKCVNKCSVSNCSVCISNYKVCETCESGYTLYQNKCIINSQACPVSNCSSCTNLVCTTCDSGFRLYNKQCYKKCTDSVCLSCDSDANICTQCEPNFKVDATTKKCVSA